jgi:hypothetical protein
VARLPTNIRFLPSALVWTALALLSGCRGDVVVHPPEQQQIPYKTEPFGPFVHMNDPEAARYFVSGVYGLESNAWRWAAGRAVLRLHLKETRDLKYAMTFAVPHEVTAHSGPVRLTILINDKKWEEISYDKDGIYEIDKPVASKLLKPEADNLVTLEIDKPWPGEGARQERGFILVRAGFLPLALER